MTSSCHFWKLVFMLISKFGVRLVESLNLEWALYGVVFETFMKVLDKSALSSLMFCAFFLPPICVAPPGVSRTYHHYSDIPEVRSGINGQFGSGLGAPESGASGAPELLDHFRQECLRVRLV